MRKTILAVLVTTIFSMGVLDAQTHAPSLDALLFDAAPATYSLIDLQTVLLEMGTIVEYIRNAYEQAYIGRPIDAAIVVQSASVKLETFDTRFSSELTRLETFATSNRRDAFGWVASAGLKHIQQDRAKLSIRVEQLKDILLLPYEQQKAALDIWRISNLGD